MALQKRKGKEVERAVQIRTIRQWLPRLLADTEPLLRIRTHSSSMKEEGTKCIQIFSYRTPGQDSKAATKNPTQFKARGEITTQFKLGCHTCPAQKSRLWQHS